MASETELLRLALMSYEAASEPELWPDFLKLYTEAVSAECSVLQIHDIGQHKSTVVSGFGLSSPFAQSYNEYYSRMNLWRERGGAYMVAGRVNIGDEMCPRGLLERSEFYNDFMLRIGGAYTMGAVITREGDRAPTVSAQRRKGPFDGPEREIAGFLLPYLNRAWTVHRRLGLLAAGESVLDTLPIGVVFLTDGGAAIYCNRAAEEIFRAYDGLSLLCDAICAADRLADARLRQAVDHAVCPTRPLGPAAVQIPRLSLRRAYQVVAAPLRSRLRQFEGLPSPVAVVLIMDPEQREPADMDFLIQMYGLTPKEAELAAKLSEGKSLEQAAEELAIRYETARTHLRRIFGKTGTSRQTELLLLMARLPASRPRENG